jgi:hypothetical protein
VVVKTVIMSLDYQAEKKTCPRFVSFASVLKLEKFEGFVNGGEMKWIGGTCRVVGRPWPLRELYWHVEYAEKRILTGN